jgi:endoglucanase
MKKITKYRFLPAFLLLNLFFSVLLGIEQVGATNALSQTLDRRANILKKGINVPFWFSYDKKAEDKSIHATTTPYLVDKDFAYLRKAGIQYIRLPLDINYFLDEGSPDLLRHREFEKMDSAIAEIIKQGFAVMIDVHTTTTLVDTNYSRRLEYDKPFRKTYAMFWQVMAANLKKHNPDQIFFEVLNEPVFLKRENEWRDITTSVVKSIHEVAPMHTVIVSATDYSRPKALATSRPLQDKNVIYNFHFYEPFEFTHQGAAWSVPNISQYSNIPYPATVAAVQKYMSGLTPAAQYQLNEYGKAGWGANKIEKMIDPAFRWAKANNVKIICNEFGIYKPFANRAMRNQWLFDVRTALEKRNIGWAIWSYDREFGLIDRTSVGDEPQSDPNMLKALGLNVSK